MTYQGNKWKQMETNGNILETETSKRAKKGFPSVIL